MIELTDQQQRELTESEPIVINPRTCETYVLVPKAAYERLKGLLAMDDFNPDEGTSYINEVMADDDAADPLLEHYQKYRKTT